jgi:hypothetical protein
MAAIRPVLPASSSTIEPFDKSILVLGIADGQRPFPMNMRRRRADRCLSRSRSGGPEMRNTRGARADTAEAVR